MTPRQSCNFILGRGHISQKVKCIISDLLLYSGTWVRQTTCTVIMTKKNHNSTLSLSELCIRIEKARHTYVTLALLNEFANVKRHDWS